MNHNIRLATTFTIALGAAIMGGAPDRALAEDGAGFCTAPARPPAARLDLAALPSRTADEFFKGNLGGRQYLLFGDTDHSDRRIHDYFYSQEHIDALAAQGVRHLFTERAPQDSQQGIDDLVAGTITPEEFAAKYVGGKLWDREGAEETRVRIAQGMVYAAGKGMKIHAANIFTKGIAAKEEREGIYQFFRDMSADFSKACPNAEHMTGEFQRQYWEKNFPLLKITEARFGQIMAERDNDAGRVDLIKSIAGNERSAIMFGAAHFFDTPRSIKTLLGAGNSIHINLFPAEDKMTESGPAANGSDFALLIDRQSVFKTGTLDFQAGVYNQPKNSIAPN